jgi:DNA-binding protein H-NS
VAKSLTQIERQIEKLQKEAETIRSVVVARIRKEMAQYGLTAEDLLGGTPPSKGRRTKGKAADAKAPKYADGAGNTWGGIGKRPAWIRAALEAGRALEEFLVGAAPKAAKAAKPARKKVAAAKKAAPARRPAAKKPASAAAAKKVAAKRPARKKATPQAEPSPAQA